MENDQVDSPEQTQPVPQAQQHPLDEQQQNDQAEDQMYDDMNGGYEFDEAEEVTGALVATRQNKKKAAEDAKLLANRIALLKLEEQKAWRKIQETKRKADQVMKTRQRNDEDRMRKEQLRQQRAEDEERRLMENQAQKEHRRQQIAAVNHAKQMKQISEAQRLKQETMKNEQIISLQKEQEYMKNNSIKEMIRQQKLEAEERKQQELAEKRLQQRNRLINSILEENNKRMEIEGQVAVLEKEEYELIQRLQNTSNIQKQAYDDLESALNGNIPQEQLEAKMGIDPSRSANGSRVNARFKKSGQK